MTDDEVGQAGSGHREAADWVGYLRRRDLVALLDSPPASLEGPVLEVGSGDGNCTDLLRSRFGSVVAFDPQPRGGNRNVLVATAERLPFRNDRFGLVVSSNVLEHIADLTAAIAEMRRVARPGAWFLHTMPTRLWKVAQLGLYPAHLGRQVLRRLRAPVPQAPADSGSQRPLRQRYSFLLPPVHGVADGHVDEFMRFGRDRWKERLETSGLSVVCTERLSLHSPYRFAPFKGPTIRREFGRAGFAAVRAYWCRDSADDAS